MFAVNTIQIQPMFIQETMNILYINVQMKSKHTANGDHTEIFYSIFRDATIMSHLLIQLGTAYMTYKLSNLNK
jgi:hypothetical protein